MEMTKALHLDSIARGGVAERFDHAILQVMENVLDPNTNPKGKRRVVITLDIVPDEARELCAVTCNVQTKLQPRNPVTSMVVVGQDLRGEVSFKELNPGQNPAQHELPDGVSRLDDARKSVSEG